ncbi:PLP-dependent aminotransferase family protein [Mycobacterium sp. CVI_P3]|uniref:PLP-dependent aminotransferase family protein n=1 Tax=Mycobacterium pinniadriaticum TaxID=2994102 RepID=A0ABT3SNI4_9MYCO|nr:PLP-dependent aminotransferase family protein [Mycobacterium pinniadriaticum]MCX2933935.1 PLP-dependent aminotransferase family protein [Mycobacterium pinniadriaticum]MCX2940357.1 PLP-dependent aminotransferase family protein [Mycobacterium pinniadriaticum]
MVTSVTTRALDPDLLARELGNWRTSSRSGPTYQGLADGLRMLIVDGRLPVGSRLPSERALADTLRVSRTTITAAYAELGESGYLHARRGARSTVALPRTAAPVPSDAPTRINLAEAALAAPASAVQEAFTEAARQSPAYLQQTGHDMRGVLAFRTAIAERYCARGLPTTPDQIMVTSGAQHAIALILATYVQPGDRVLVEQPTYHGVLTAIATAGARPVPVAMTREGWDLDAVHAAVRQLAPTLAYLVPDNHNPTGFSMPPADRKRLSDIVSETRTRTVIDETMTDVWLDEPVPPPVAASMTSRTDLMITIGSMSKSYWGGMRIGWIRAEPNVLATIRALRPSMDLGTSVIEQLAAAWLLTERADDVLPERREILRGRRTLLLELIAEHLPDWRPLPGNGGMSMWVQLPAPVSSAMCASASRLGVELPPGPRFGVDGTLERFVRIPFALPEDELTEAIELLGRAWRSITGAATPETTAVVI